MALLAFFALFLVGVAAESQQYYTLIEAMQSGVDFYEVMGLDRNCTNKEIRKSFRNLSLKYHPDKLVEGDGGEELYIRITKAYECLMDPEVREEYDVLLRDGVPYYEKYYGRYASRWGAPTHDIRKVLIVVITLLTILHYLYLLNRWQTKRRRVTEHPYYQQKLRQAQKEKEHAKKQAQAVNGKKPSKKNQKKQQEDDGDESDEELGELTEAFYHIDKLDKPKITDLLFVRIAELPWTLPHGIFKFCEKYTADFDEKEGREAEIMERFGLTPEEMEMERLKSDDRYNKFKNSTRYKKMQRFMKKRATS